MKIAIIGAHRVGKTTLTEKLQEHLSGYELMPEPYYELVESGHEFAGIPNADDFIEQLEYSVKQIEASGDKVIFDRCPIDFLAYLQALTSAGNIHSFYTKVQNVMAEIDFLVFVPIEEPDFILCQPSELPELRNQVNEILHEWIPDFGVETIEVKGTLQNRVDQVLGKIH